MANINEMIAEVEKINPELASGFRKYVRDHSYGLVYERNLPDAVRLWTKKPTKFDKVHILPPRGEMDNEENYKVWYVSDIVDDTATLSDGKEVKIVSVQDIVPVVSHRDVIYPGLKVVDKVERGGKDDPYHILINAENYHALQMLGYAYAGQVDCIYIDPPYNTGAKDWKYNNNYVGEDDKYRHSKWLTMMERRLKLAKDLLNPKNSVMIVTIDEKEYLRLGMLLEQMFPEARIQMISSVINPPGSIRKDEFSRTNEFVFFVKFGSSSVLKLPLSDDWRVNAKDKRSIGFHWERFIRTGTASRRVDVPNQFYPIYIANDGSKIIEIGEPLSSFENKDTVLKRNDCITLFPLHFNGEEGCWRYISGNAKELLKKGFLRLQKKSDGNYIIYYLPKGIQDKVNNNTFPVIGYNSDGSVICSDENFKYEFVPGSQWNILSHFAREFGSNINKLLLEDRKFPFPKSLYAVEDCLRFFVADKPNALVVDFFAGSGTTAHATMLLNHLDGGHRRCISVTNNEIGPDNEKAFTKQGLRPTDKEWQSKGIAHYITWERIKAAITGIATNGEPIKGDYKFTEEFPMSDGFKENAIFCELTYEKLWDIRLDRAFNAIAPILWAMAGAKGKIIEKLGKGYATTDNYAVLFRFDAISKLAEALKDKPSIKCVFVVTDDQERFSLAIKKFYMIKPENIHRLYESYLRSFEIVGEGGLD